MGWIEKFRFSEVVTIIVSLLLIFFVAKIVYDDKILKEYLHEFEKKNLEIEEKNRIQNINYKYFETPQFKDLYAKENLNLLRTWEKAMIIKKEKSKIDFIEKAFNHKKEENIENYDIVKQWGIYFNIYKTESLSM